MTRSLTSPGDTVDRPAVSLAAPLIGCVGSVVGLLVGGWLMLAPFALGYQPSNGDWTDTTVTDFFTGLGVAVIAAVALVTFGAALVVGLRTLGATAAQRKVRGAAEPGGNRRPPAGPVSQNAASDPSASEVAALLEPLVRALREDLAASGDARGPSDPYPQVSRRNPS